MAGVFNHDAAWHVCIEVMGEMERQIVKWGEQNHSDYVLDDVFAQAAMDGYEGSVLDTDRAKQVCDLHHNARLGSWQDILNEEVMEARDEAIAGNEEALREELVQVAAVVCSWIQAIDRRKLLREPSTNEDF